MRQNLGNWYSVPSLGVTFITLTSIIWGCALPAAPDGGPRDKEPPVILEASVPHGSVNVRGNEISWRFDEFVVLSSPQQNFTSSPPLPVGTTYELRRSILNS